MFIELETFSRLYPRATSAPALVEAMNELFEFYNINNPERIAAVWAVCSVETGQWTRFEENLRYSAKRMQQVWPKYFRNNRRNPYNYQYSPERLANLVYSNKIGNGPESSGDGYRFRGRGPIQLTGRANYTNFVNDTQKTEVLDNPDLLLEPYYGILSVCWFWWKGKINQHADAHDMRRITRIVNGPMMLALEERTREFNRILPYLKQDELKQNNCR